MLSGSSDMVSLIKGTAKDFTPEILAQSTFCSSLWSQSICTHFFPSLPFCLEHHAWLHKSILKIWQMLKYFINGPKKLRQLLLDTLQVCPWRVVSRAYDILSSLHHYIWGWSIFSENALQEFQKSEPALKYKLWDVSEIQTTANL